MYGIINHFIHRYLVWVAIPDGMYILVTSLNASSLSDAVFILVKQYSLVQYALTLAFTFRSSLSAQLRFLLLIR